MNSKLLIIFVGLAIFSIMLPCTVSEKYSESYYNSHILRPPRIYFREGDPSDEELSFEDPEGHFYTHHFEIRSGQSLTFSVRGVRGRIVNPDVALRLSFNPAGIYNNHYDNSVILSSQLRCDADGDGIFEYIVDFPNTLIVSQPAVIEIDPDTITGEPIEMTDGAIELDINRTDNSPWNLELGSDFNAYIQVPFDLDTDSDGTGDFTDLDNDGDGVRDWDDEFPLDGNEWEDTDGDGIGDNADTDNNDNNIPDDMEVPLAMGIMLIPLVVIIAVMNRMKKKGGKDEEDEIPTITTPHEGPKNW